MIAFVTILLYGCKFRVMPRNMKSMIYVFFYILFQDYIEDQVTWLRNKYELYIRWQAP